MEFHDLAELGLTTNESKAYITLLEHDKLSAGEISKFSSVPYSRIYDVLASLEQKGFVKIVPEKTKKFVPSSPEDFNAIIKKKQESLDELKKKISQMKSFYELKAKNPVILGYGKPAFYKLVKESKEPSKYSYSVKFTSEYRPEWEANYRRDLKKGVEKKSLVRYDKETEKNVRVWFTLGKKYMRKFPNEGVAMSITDDEEVLLGLINSNMTLLIKDRAFAKIMKKMFLETYKNAEEIR